MFFLASEKMEALCYASMVSLTEVGNLARFARLSKDRFHPEAWLLAYFAACSEDPGGAAWKFVPALHGRQDEVLFCVALVQAAEKNHHVDLVRPEHKDFRKKRRSTVQASTKAQVFAGADALEHLSGGGADHLVPVPANLPRLPAQRALRHAVLLTVETFQTFEDGESTWSSNKIARTPG